MKAPHIHNIETVEFLLPQEYRLYNNIPLFVFGGSRHQIIRLDILFNAGRWVEDKQLIADAYATLSKSGTQRLSSFQLNEEIDFFGATIKIMTGYNTITFSVSCLTPYFESILKLLQKCLNDIQFPEHEIDLFKTNAKARLKVSEEKTDYVADVTFKQIIFGNKHPYGYSTTAQQIDNIEQSDLLDYYKKHIHYKNATIFIAGNISEKEIQLTNKYIGKWQKEHQLVTKKHRISNNKQQHHYIEKANSVQASLVIGKRLFNKTHKDYGAFMLLNTILGGYFGSRLMNNIREEKGLTYGIYSMLSPLKYAGIWAIYTDTNKSKLKICLSEIYKELDIISNHKVSEQEIKLARNYMLGRYLKRTDGCFNLMETFKSYYIEEVSIDTFQNTIQQIRQTDGTALLLLAQQHLNPKDLYEVVVG